ncbi:MAG: superinfection immunity protein [Pseudonocardiaceae bacterium]|nr:MAG: superinfection immunity protein [Pseudonocardiaceae bacterium]
MVVQFFYLLPAFLAYQRAHPQRHAIFLINLFLGWTAIGRIGALVWSVSSSREKLA